MNYKYVDSVVKETSKCIKNFGRTIMKRLNLKSMCLYFKFKKFIESLL